MDYTSLYMDEAKKHPPAMFGDLQGCSTGRFSSAAPKRARKDIKAGLDKIEAAKPKYKCICGAIGVLAPHTQTCKDYNWQYHHPINPMT